MASRSCSAPILSSTAALRFLALGSESLWYDEAYAWEWVQQPQAALWGPVAAIGPTPPLYYGLLRAWSHAWGDSEAVLRMPSALCGVLSGRNRVGRLQPAPRPPRDG